MFDVRPVDETGDLDWKKIQAIGGLNECVGDEPSGFGREQELMPAELQEQVPEFDGSGLNAYVLGAPIESRSIPILHDPNFNFGEFCVGDESRDISFANKPILKNFQLLEEKMQAQSIKEEQRRSQLAQQEILFEKRDNARKELEMRLAVERNQKEAELVAKKIEQQKMREEIIRTEAIKQQEKLKEAVQYNRQQDEAYNLAVMLERKQREKEYAEWLEKEMQEEAKAQRLQMAIAKKIEKSKRKEASKRKWLGRSDLADFSWRELLFPAGQLFKFDINKSLRAFASVALIVSFSLGTVTYASKGLGIKGKVLGSSTDGLASLNLAISDVAHQNFEGSTVQFDKAFANFSEGSQQLESMGGVLLDATRYVPFASKLSSGKNAVEAGKHFSVAGKSLSEVAKVASELKNPIASSGQSSVSLLDVFVVAQKNITEAKTELKAAQQNIDRISIDDLPEDKRDKFLLVKKQLPDLLSGLDLFLANSHIIADLLGANGPRKYLFLFQNNSEMRATGGFIGSYGLLDIANGHVKKFFIDGIFNPDGQLKDKIVPPMPIQKISANWSMHDSNWFADFPMSAKKAIQFYEKTGGPTADGVITLTPTVMQKLLEITGPIEMPEYDVTLDSDNFVELTQYKVEVDYDKEENKPKKILSDLAPMVLDKLLSNKDLEVVSKTAQAFLEGLKEKHILFYSENAELQKIISAQGWSGEVISTPKDYISVINTNVNGFKTDAVVDESIEHKAEIQVDGSIIDTVTITRKHNGGNSEYEWLNKVNADYMRVYVPEGSKLLEVSGQTRESNEPPLDYDALGFQRDQEVQKEENNMIIDPASGTRVYTEFGKTVFANWTYVSPQETMIITYKYLLPFSMFKVSVGQAEQVDSYSLTAQKQSGSFGSSFESIISYPANYDVKWNFPSDVEIVGNSIKSEGMLKNDKFQGAVFEKK